MPSNRSPAPQPPPEPSDPHHRKTISFAPETWPIQLGPLLKLALGVSGGEAKRLIQQGMVRVDSALETRRGRKLHGGEHIEVEFAEELVRIEVSGPS